MPLGYCFTPGHNHLWKHCKNNPNRVPVDNKDQEDQDPASKKPRWTKVTGKKSSKNGNNGNNNGHDDRHARDDVASDSESSGAEVHAMEDLSIDAEETSIDPEKEESSIVEDEHHYIGDIGAEGLEVELNVKDLHLTDITDEEWDDEPMKE